MAVVSGQVTFDTGGTVDVNFGITVNSLDIIAGYTGGAKSWGHADSSNQFCYNQVSVGGKDTSHVIVIYNSSGAKVVEAKVMSGWGTSILRFSVTAFSASFPWDAIVRS